MKKASTQRQDKAAGFSQKEFARRHSRIRELMQLRGIDCLIITGHSGGFGSAGADIRYVSGLPGAILTDGPYIVFPQLGEPLGIASSPFAAAWAMKTSCVPVEAVSFKKGTRIRDYTTDVVARIKELDLERATIGIVSMRVMPAYVYTRLLEELPRANFVSAGDLLLEARMVKSPEEITFLRRSGEWADSGLEAIVEAARPGMTETELVAICDAAMVDAGADRGNFILLGSGAWSKMQGTISGGTEKKLTKGDVIFTEITSNYRGYYTQLCCPISLGGRFPDSFRKFLDIEKAMYKFAYEELRPGNSVSAIEAKVEKLAASMGGEFRRAWALQIAELAESFFKLDLELKAGMAYVIHPWLEPLSGKGYNGHTIGNTCIVTDGKPEVLNKSLQEVRVV
jgi:Xaa-Pro aminopeptidase